jgi:hypothetical protein
MDTVFISESDTDNYHDLDNFEILVICFSFFLSSLLYVFNWVFEIDYKFN